MLLSIAVRVHSYKQANDRMKNTEVPVRFELTNTGFADLRLTTWPRNLI